MTPDARKALVALAREATPGPWDEVHNMSGPMMVKGGVDRGYVCHLAMNRYEHANAAFIASANPAAIISMAERIEVLEGAWDWLAQNRNLELSFGYHDDETEGLWRLHSVNGGVNDREWSLIASGETPLRVVQEARQALAATQEAGGE